MFFGLLLQIISFNPLPSHEGRLCICISSHNFSSLSIHFPLTREDYIGLDYARQVIFQSTSLSRGKTQFFSGGRGVCDLSIHFPLTREDKAGNMWEIYNGSFNPLPSHEGRHSTNRFFHSFAVFQSTSLSRGKTVYQ